MPPIGGTRQSLWQNGCQTLSGYPDIIEVTQFMARPIEVKALPAFRIWLRNDDGTAGEVDLSDLAGRGVFQAWNDLTFFNSVRLAAHGAIEWDRTSTYVPMRCT